MPNVLDADALAQVIDVVDDVRLRALLSTRSRGDLFLFFGWFRKVRRNNGWSTQYEHLTSRPRPR